MDFSRQQVNWILLFLLVVVGFLLWERLTGSQTPIPLFEGMTGQNANWNALVSTIYNNPKPALSFFTALNRGKGGTIKFPGKVDIDGRLVVANAAMINNYGSENLALFTHKDRRGNDYGMIIHTNGDNYINTKSKHNMTYMLHGDDKSGANPNNTTLFVPDKIESYGHLMAEGSLKTLGDVTAAGIANVGGVETSEMVNAGGGFKSSGGGLNVKGDITTKNGIVRTEGNGRIEGEHVWARRELVTNRLKVYGDTLYRDDVSDPSRHDWGTWSELGYNQADSPPTGSSVFQDVNFWN